MSAFRSDTDPMTKSLDLITIGRAGVDRKRWTRLVRQFGGLAKVDRVGFYAASRSVISAVA